MPDARNDPSHPTPLPQLLRFWAFRVAIMTVIVALLQTYGDPVWWLWPALAGYAAFSLGMTLLMDRIRTGKAQQAAQTTRPPDPSEHTK